MDTPKKRYIKAFICTALIVISVGLSVFANVYNYLNFPEGVSSLSIPGYVVHILLAALLIIYCFSNGNTKLLISAFIMTFIWCVASNIFNYYQELSTYRELSESGLSFLREPRFSSYLFSIMITALPLLLMAFSLIKNLGNFRFIPVIVADIVLILVMASIGASLHSMLTSEHMNYYNCDAFSTIVSGVASIIWYFSWIIVTFPKIEKRKKSEEVAGVTVGVTPNGSAMPTNPVPNSTERTVHTTEGALQALMKEYEQSLISREEYVRRRQEILRKI